MAQVALHPSAKPYWPTPSAFTGKIIVLDVIVPSEKSAIQTTVRKIQAANFKFPLVEKQFVIAKRQRVLGVNAIPCEAYALRFRGIHKLGQTLGIVLFNQQTKKESVIEKFEDLLEREHYGSYVTGSFMQFIPGDTLFASIHRQDGFRGAEALNLSLQVLEAVQNLHHLRPVQAGRVVVHRDLKPENFMDNGGDITLIDFDMANEINRFDPNNPGCGSPHYAAPELVQAIPIYDESVDRFACGVILYALATNSMIFDDENSNIPSLLDFIDMYGMSRKTVDQFRELAATLSGKPKSPPSPALAELLSMTAKNPDQQKQLETFAKDMLVVARLLDSLDPRLKAVIVGLTDSVPELRWSFKQAIDTLKNPWPGP